MVGLVPAKMKKIGSKMEALECSQHFTSGFQTLTGSYFRSWWWYHAIFMHVLVTCKNEIDSMTNEGASVVTTFFP